MFEGKNSRSNQYDEDYFKDRVTFIEGWENVDTEKIRLTSDILFFEHIKNLNLNGLQPLQIISKGRAKLLFNDLRDANNVLKINDFNARNLKAYIPRSFTETLQLILMNMV